MLKDTIISAFNYDGTLLKWLKKVENALEGDTLTNIEVVTNSDYSMQLKMTFGDNTFIMSPAFTNKGRGIVSITKTATSGLVDTYTVTYTDNTTSEFTVTNAEGFNANNLYSTLTAGTGIELTNDGQSVTVTAKRLLNEIVDSQGHNRFIQGTPTENVLEGVTHLYKSYVLNGHSLRIIDIVEIAPQTTLANAVLLILDFRDESTNRWIFDKIVPIYSNVIAKMETIDIASPSSNPTKQLFSLTINPPYNVWVYLPTTLTNSSNVSMYFRIEFNLIID